jgi:hypothetical protein
VADVLVGEVWLGSGQPNMKMMVIRGIGAFRRTASSPTGSSLVATGAGIGR